MAGKQQLNDHFFWLRKYDISNIKTCGTQVVEYEI